MKKLACFVVLIALLLPVLCACGEKHTSAADAYLDIAQGYVDEGKYAAAISTLEKGYKATVDSRIAVMMAELAIHKEDNEEAVPENVATEPTEKATEPVEIVTTTPATQPKETEAPTNPMESVEEVFYSYSPYVGKWQDTWSKRANMTITPTNGGYKVVISWASSASEVAKWEMTARDAEGDSLFSNDCRHWIEYCDEAGNVTKQLIYTGGQVTLGIFDGVLLWFDYTQEAGENCCFEKVGAEKESPNKEQQASGYPIQIDMQDMLSAEILGYTFFQACEGREITLSDWMFLYVHGGSDPAVVYPEFWYDENLGQMTYYGIYYQQAVEAGWGDVWVLVVNGR